MPRYPVSGSPRPRAGFAQIAHGHRGFARRMSRHPAIVAGRLQHDDPSRYNRYRKFLVKVSRYLEIWIDCVLPVEHAA